MALSLQRARCNRARDLIVKLSLSINPQLDCNARCNRAVHFDFNFWIGRSKPSLKNQSAPTNFHYDLPPIQEICSLHCNARCNRACEINIIIANLLQKLPEAAKLLQHALQSAHSAYQLSNSFAFRMAGNQTFLCDFAEYRKNFGAFWIPGG